jgi:hypothetical protein
VPTFSGNDIGFRLAATLKWAFWITSHRVR